jgi:ribosomal protein S18 acetylase RimI-like enzyme
MIIRKATVGDSTIISEHLFLAIEDFLYQFMGIEDAEKAKEFLLHFVKKENNQYSFQNCLVAEIENEIIGSINIYDGAKLGTLSEPIVQYVKTYFDIDFNPEKETQQGEYYIDSFGVSANHQGKGVGTKILQHIIKAYTVDNQQTLGLLVDEENPNAEKLYLKLGFEFAGRKVLVGKKMKHLQKKPKNEI